MLVPSSGKPKLLLAVTVQVCLGDFGYVQSPAVGVVFAVVLAHGKLMGGSSEVMMYRRWMDSIINIRIILEDHPRNS